MTPTIQIQTPDANDLRMKEINIRVQYACRQAGFKYQPFTTGRTDIRFDLWNALAFLMETNQIPTSRVAAFGELSLDGRVLPVRGSFGLIESAVAENFERILIPQGNSPTAAGPTIPVTTLRKAIESLNADPTPATPFRVEASVDMSDIRGMDSEKEAVMIAAAGGHSVLLEGFIGCGKTMLARRIPTILPDLTPEEMRDVARVQSNAGYNGVTISRPLRAPHFTISNGGLIGNATFPGELSLAKNGVFFADEAVDFRQDQLDAIRAADSATMVVYSHYGCWCGRPDSCVCSKGEILARSKKSASLGAQMRIPVKTMKTFPDKQGPTSAEMKAKVTAARAIQMNRQGCLNAHLSDDAVQNADWAAGLLDTSPSVLRVARTIADIEGVEINESHVQVAATLV